jgi:hypothetical protein
MKTLATSSAPATVVPVVALLALSAFSSPPAHPLVGKWNVEYERGRQVINDEVTVINGKATLEIAERGDSLVGTLTPDNGGPAQAINGKGSGNAATLVTTNVARINESGEERQITMTLTWQLKVDGDNLTGTMVRSAKDMPVPVRDAPVKGTRVK